MSYEPSGDHGDTEESFFVSMTDIMVGLLFIFIILVVYFVLQVSIETQKLRIIEEKTGPEMTRRTQLDAYRIKVAQQRAVILEGLQSFFQNEGFTDVTIDVTSGVLRFPDGVLFESGEYAFSEGTLTADAVETLADAFAEVLPCSVLDSEGSRYTSKSDCRLGHSAFPNVNNAFVSSIYIEGHTDIIPVGPQGLRGDPKLSTNLKLSTRRATNTYEKAVLQRPELQSFYGLVSVNGLQEISEVQPALAVSGYGAQRPIGDNKTKLGRRSNRRIDIRIVMYQPFDFQDLEAVRNRFGEISKRSTEDVVG